MYIGESTVEKKYDFTNGCCRGHTFEFSRDDFETGDEMQKTAVDFKRRIGPNMVPENSFSEEYFGIRDG